MQRITIDPYTLEGVQELIDSLETLRKNLDPKVEELVRRLTELGYTEVSAQYANAEYAGDYDITVDAVSVRKEGSSYIGTISAHGEAILFVEFGTGILSSSAPAEEYALSDTPISAHGTYGKGYGSRTGGWAYEGVRGSRAPADTVDIKSKPGWVHTYGNDATPGMYLAWKKIADDFAQVAMEVFGND